MNYLGYSATDVASFAKAYKCFYDAYDLIKQPLIPIKEKKEFAKRIEDIFGLCLLKCTDVLKQDGILEDMYSKINELNEKYQLNIKTPNLEHIIKNIESKNK
jgi:hypothetical protein